MDHVSGRGWGEEARKPFCGKQFLEIRGFNSEGETTRYDDLAEENSNLGVFAHRFPISEQ